MKKVVKKKKKEYNRADFLLLGAFIVMLLIFIGLLIGLFVVKDKQKKENSNITIPIIEDNLSTTLGIDVSNKKEGEKVKYSFKIRNYNKNKVNREKYKYVISILEEETKGDYKLTANDKEIKIDDYKSEILELPNKEKTEIKYDLIITLKQKTGKDKYIYFNVGGIKNGSN